VFTALSKALFEQTQARTCILHRPCSGVEWICYIKYTQFLQLGVLCECGEVGLQKASVDLWALDMLFIPFVPISEIRATHVELYSYDSSLYFPPIPHIRYKSDIQNARTDVWTYGYTP
jgi:hypothetical protein